MKDIIKKEGKLVATPEYRLKKFVNHRTFKPFFMEKSFLPDIYKTVSDQIPTTSSFLLIEHKEDILHYILFILMMRRGHYEDVSIINAYSLLDIMLSNNEEYRTVTDVSDKLVIIYMGYSEMKNIRQQDVVNQLIEYQRVQGKECYLIYKGDFFQKKFPSIYDTLRGIKSTSYLKVDLLPNTSLNSPISSANVSSETQSSIPVMTMNKGSVTYDISL